MSFEIEIKFRVTNPNDLRHRVEALGAVAGPELEQEDAYLSHPSRDFKQSGEALRLRREGSDHKITYKGPKFGGPTKTRSELEIPYGSGPEDADRLAKLMEALGFRPVAVIRKSRTPFQMTYHNRPMMVFLDRTEGLGTFAEVEALAATAADLPAAQAAVLALATELGLTEVEPRSYLRMLLERRAS